MTSVLLDVGHDALWAVLFIAALLTVPLTRVLVRRLPPGAVTGQPHRQPA